MDGMVRDLAAEVDIAEKKPRFYEFFSGGGLVRLGLGREWVSVGAIDSDPAKIAIYKANFGEEGVVQDDIRSLSAADMPGILDLAWASFPYTDISIAGTRTGLDGSSSGAFWPCWKVIGSSWTPGGRLP